MVVPLSQRCFFKSRHRRVDAGQRVATCPDVIRHVMRRRHVMCKGINITIMVPVLLKLLLRICSAASAVHAARLHGLRAAAGVLVGQPHVHGAVVQAAGVDGAIIIERCKQRGRERRIRTYVAE